MLQQQSSASLTHGELERLLEAPKAYNREAVDSVALLQALRPELEKQRRAMEWANSGIAVGGGVLLPLGLLCLAITWPLSLFGILPTLLIVSALSSEGVEGELRLPNPFCAPFVPYRLTQQLTLVAHQLEKEQDVAVVPPLLDLLQRSGDPALSSQAARALSQLRHKVIQLLPYLTSESAQALTESQRGYIRRHWLQPGSDPRGQVAALLVMASARDQVSVPLAYTLLARTTNEAVKEAVRELLNAVGG